MPSSFVPEKMYSDITGQTALQDIVSGPWPDDVQLFQPDVTTQILLPDNANCLAVQAFLKMCNLKYDVVYRRNAEYMSPTGKVPFIKSGAFIVPELDGVISHVRNKNISLTDNLDDKEKADMRAFMCLINNVILNAELFITWCDPEVYKEVTWKRYASIYPWPLNYILTSSKRHQTIKYLECLQWYKKKSLENNSDPEAYDKDTRKRIALAYRWPLNYIYTFCRRFWDVVIFLKSFSEQGNYHVNSLEDVYVEVETSCQALSDRLGDQPFFFGEEPTELDALLFAHVYTIISTPLPTNKFAGIIRCFSNIVDHCKRIEKMYFTPYLLKNVDNDN